MENKTQTRDNNLDYLVDPRFGNINRLFVLSFKNGYDDPILLHDISRNQRLYCLKYSKPFIDQPVKNKQGEYEKLIEMSNNNDYTTRRLLDYLYHQKFYKLIGTDSWRETNTNIPRQMNFVGTSEED